MKKQHHAVMIADPRTGDFLHFEEGNYVFKRGPVKGAVFEHHIAVLMLKRSGAKGFKILSIDEVKMLSEKSPKS